MDYPTPEEDGDLLASDPLDVVEGGLVCHGYLLWIGRALARPPVLDCYQRTPHTGLNWTRSSRSIRIRAASSQ